MEWNKESTHGCAHVLRRWLLIGLGARGLRLLTNDCAVTRRRSAARRKRAACQQPVANLDKIHLHSNLHFYNPSKHKYSH